MNKKNFYLTIIAALIIYLILIIAVSLNNIYTNALIVEDIVDKTEMQVSRASRVLCEPIIENRNVSPLPPPFSVKVGTPEGIRFCEQVQ